MHKDEIGEKRKVGVRKLGEDRKPKLALKGWRQG